MSKAEELKFAETVADSLREVYFTTIDNASEPLRLDLLELCNSMGGTVYEITSYSSKDDYNMLEIEEDGLFLHSPQFARSHGCTIQILAPFSDGYWRLAPQLHKRRARCLQNI